jgi:hypothetical protein
MYRNMYTGVSKSIEKKRSKGNTQRTNYKRMMIIGVNRMLHVGNILNTLINGIVQQFDILLRHIYRVFHQHNRYAYYPWSGAMTMAAE